MDCNSTKTEEYFTDASLLARIPQAMFYLAAVYAALILIGFLMITEKPKTKDDEKPKLSSKLIKTFQFLCTKILNTRDFWFLFLSRSSEKDKKKYVVEDLLSRLTYMIIIAGLLIFWKSVSLKLSGNDQLVSSLGGNSVFCFQHFDHDFFYKGILSVMNCLSRFLGGYLNDRFPFRFFQSIISLTIIIVFISTM